MQWGLVVLVKKEQKDMEEVAQLISGRVEISSISCFMHQGEKSTFLKFSLDFYRGKGE